ncbi:MAG TPA: hypothetical protein VE224_08485, partial [Pseudolabrys sp.]|nr:hypothetical protein [Pseudolabrys sp.]
MAGSNAPATAAQPLKGPSSDRRARGRSAPSIEASLLRSAARVLAAFCDIAGATCWFSICSHYAPAWRRVNREADQSSFSWNFSGADPFIFKIMYMYGVGSNRPAFYLTAHHIPPPALSDINDGALPSTRDNGRTTAASARDRGIEMRTVAFVSALFALLTQPALAQNPAPQSTATAQSTFTVTP